VCVSVVLADALGLERRFGEVSVAELETFNALAFAWGGLTGGGIYSMGYPSAISGMVHLERWVLVSVFEKVFVLL